MPEYWKPDIERYVKRMAWIGSIFVWVIVGIIVRFDDAIAALQKDDPSRLFIYIGGSALILAVTGYINGGAVRRNKISPYLLPPLVLKQPIVWLTLIGVATTAVFQNTQ